MAKPPSPSGDAATPAEPMAKPKAAAKSKPVTKAKATPKPKASAKPMKIAKPPKIAKPKAPTAKAPKAKAPSAQAEAKSLLATTSAKISQLAQDILADRIVPTIDQIKAIAAHALGKDDKKGKKAKGKK